MAIGITNTDPEREVELIYVNARLVGNGAFGQVRYAELHPSGEKVAVKKVFDDPRYRNRELQISKLMDHPVSIFLYIYLSRKSMILPFSHLECCQAAVLLLFVCPEWAQSEPGHGVHSRHIDGRNTTVEHER